MRIILVTAVVALGLAACGSNAPARDSAQLRVVASFYPLAEAAHQVGGPHVVVTNLTPPGGEPHDLEPTTRQVDRILGADVVIEMGRRFQPGVEAATRHRPKGTTLAVLDQLGIPAGSVAEEGAPGSGVDPHVWLDPTTMRSVVTAIAHTLERLAPTPTIATDIRGRAAAYDARLAALGSEYAAGLRTCASRTIVTSHAAFGWLARRYHLEQRAITGLAPEQEPDPRRIAELVDLVRTEHLTTIFTETLVSPKVARALAREAGVQTAVLDPLEGLTAARLAAGDDYLGVMRSNLQRLRTALSCT